MRNQKRKITNEWFILLICLGTISCDMQEKDRPVPNVYTMKFLATQIFDSASNPNIRVDTNLIYEENFEGSNPLDFTWKQFSSSHSFGTSSNVKFQGDKSGKFELRYDDQFKGSSGIRSEVLFPIQNQRERWYSFAVNFPSDGFQKDRDTEIISQWHQEGMGSPSASLNVRNDRLILIVGNVQTGSSNKDNIDLGQVPKNSWNELIFHYVHSNGSDGLIEVWQNGKKILTRKGGNIYRGTLPKWKIGLYKWTWANKKTDVSKRILYYDNVRMGNQNASFYDMTSTGKLQGSSNTPPESNPESTSTVPSSTGYSPITSFSLIQSNINRNLQEISTGNTIIATTHKLNIQANVDAGFIGTVSFSLRGAIEQNFMDNTAPFTLFGDDGSGNYYFGSGLPRGDYSLVATPSNGASKTIEFTLR